MLKRNVCGTERQSTIEDAGQGRLIIECNAVLSSSTYDILTSLMSR